jgi:hypothetical protein
MDLGAILLLLALLLGVGFYLAAPLISNTTRRGVHESQEVSSLLAERDRVINSLQELDFDFKLGKIPEEDYPVQRLALLQKGAGVLKKLESLSASDSPLELGSEGGSQDAESRIEQLASGSSDQLTDDKIEAMLSARRKARKTKSAGFCPRCGKPVLVSDKFCPNCGKSQV